MGTAWKSGRKSFGKIEIDPSNGETGRDGAGAGEEVANATSETRERRKKSKQ